MATDGRVARVREVRETLAEASGRYARSDGDFERVSLPAGDADVLRDLLIAERPRVVIEVGLAYGSSALAVAEALLNIGRPRPRHVIVDAFQDRFGDAGWNAITTAGVADVSCLLRERSQIVLPRLMADGFVADAAFVDGSHHFHNVFVDLYFLGELTRPGGLVVLDDCDWPSVSAAARYFELNLGWRREPINDPTRLAAFRLPNPRVEPNFEDFKPFALG
jgi:predicted O-methyltransferase YrrM